MAQQTKWYGPGPYSTYEMLCKACRRKWLSQPRTVAPTRCPSEGCRSRAVTILAKRL